MVVIVLYSKMNAIWGPDGDIWHQHGRDSSRPNFPCQHGRFLILKRFWNLLFFIVFMIFSLSTRGPILRIVSGRPIFPCQHGGFLNIFFSKIYFVLFFSRYWCGTNSYMFICHQGINNFYPRYRLLFLPSDSLGGVHLQNMTPQFHDEKKHRQAAPLLESKSLPKPHLPPANLVSSKNNVFLSISSRKTKHSEKSDSWILLLHIRICILFKNLTAGFCSSALANRIFKKSAVLSKKMTPSQAFPRRDCGLKGSVLPKSLFSATYIYTHQNRQVPIPLVNQAVPLICRY